MGRQIICRNCGLNFYLNSVPTAAAILSNKKGEILLVRRKFDPKKGFWDLPGGFIELYETFDNGIKREIKEELGVDIGNLLYSGSSADTYQFKGITYSTVTAVYYGTIEGNIYPGDDVDDFSFFNPRELPFKNFAFPSLARVIKKFIKVLDSSA